MRLHFLLLARTGKWTLEDICASSLELGGVWDTAHPKKMNLHLHYQCYSCHSTSWKTHWGWKWRLMWIKHDGLARRVALFYQNCWLQCHCDGWLGAVKGYILGLRSQQISLLFAAEKFMNAVLVTKFPALEIRLRDASHITALHLLALQFEVNASKPVFWGCFGALDRMTIFIKALRLLKPSTSWHTTLGIEAR